MFYKFCAYNNENTMANFYEESKSGNFDRLVKISSDLAKMMDYKKVEIYKWDSSLKQYSVLAVLNYWGQEFAS